MHSVDILNLRILDFLNFIKFFDFAKKVYDCLCELHREYCMWIYGKNYREEKWYPMVMPILDKLFLHVEGSFLKVEERMSGLTLDTIINTIIEYLKLHEELTIRDIDKLEICIYYDLNFHETFEHLNAYYLLELDKYSSIPFKYYLQMNIEFYSHEIFTFLSKSRKLHELCKISEEISKYERKIEKEIHFLTS